MNESFRPLWLLAGGGLLTLAGCATMEATAPVVTPTMATTVGESEGQLQEGRRLLATRCTNCHSLEPVAKYSSAEWKGLVADMAPRSNLSAQEQRLITDYLIAARASVSPPGG